MPPNRFESEVESFLEGSHGDRTHIKRADHHTVTPLCGTLLIQHVVFQEFITHAVVSGLHEPAQPRLALGYECLECVMLVGVCRTRWPSVPRLRR